MEENSDSFPQETAQVLRDINPWWDSGRVRPTPPAYERTQVRALLKALDRPEAKIQALRGPRQVGKSTAILQFVRLLLAGGARPRDVFFIRFDLDILRDGPGLLPLLRWYAKTIRKKDLAETPPFFLLLDEIHKLPKWADVVKHVFDTYRPRMVITGSSSVLVARGQRESLAGRALTSEIPPFLFREVLELCKDNGINELPSRLEVCGLPADPEKAASTFKSIHAQPPQRMHGWRRRLDRYYNRGGYPDLHTGAVEEERWADYLTETVFDRVLGVDIPDLFPVDQPRLLRHVYMEVARRTGQEISQKRVADEAHAAGYSTNQPTVGRYLHYLTDALLIREFRRFPLTRKASAKVPAKYALSDLGVRNAIFRGAPSLWESAPDVVGPLVETLVQTVIRGTGVQAHFYRSLRDPSDARSGFEEVDFVVEGLDGTLLPIEVKFRRRIGSEDLSAVSRFVEAYKAPLGIVVTRESFDWLPARKLILVPLLDFLLAF
jgi:predicted AAA+ superfamily ATPase